VKYLKGKKLLITIPLFFLAVFTIWIIIPVKIRSKPESLVLLDKKGNLFGGKIASDGQWRFPHSEKIPGKFDTCIIAFEDKRFYSHPGLDPLALFRAIKNNLRGSKKISGASTITMQLARITNENPERSIWQKIKETCLAFKYEVHYSKKEILAYYVSNAPFGGNVVGLEAASWRYYGKPSHLLTWSECATLAVLPNSPSLIHPGRNRKILESKRNFLLNKLLHEKQIDSTTAQLAKLEPIPERPLSLPRMARHLLEKIESERKKKNTIGTGPIYTTLDIKVQRKLNSLVADHAGKLAVNGIYNVAAIIVDVATGDVIAYTANVPENKNASGSEVDLIRSPRSSGSILKPLLYASMLDEGSLLPEMLIPDIPIQIKNFTPKNFDFTYDGAVPANRALSRSLNIPAVHMLKTYTPSKFCYQLKRLGFKNITRPSEDYGLTLILGGAETTLWDLASVYKGFSRTLLNYNKYTQYFSEDFFSPQLIVSADIIKSSETFRPSMISAGAIWLTFEAMIKVNRPDQQKYWQIFQHNREVAWKTGTSFGDRDAWAVGCTPDYVVAVWCGNATGEGRPGLTGTQAAAPLMFDIFNFLPKNSEWFKMPTDDMTLANLCERTGYIAGTHCEKQIEKYIPSSASPNNVCPYHHTIFLDSKERFQVTSDCESVGNFKAKTWFVLPPSMEHFYKLKYSDYKKLPPFRDDCNKLNASNNLAVLYPRQNTKVIIPRDLNGKKSASVFEVAHRNPSAMVYWHMDENYTGVTKAGIHQKAFNISAGKHKLTITDDAGETIAVEFEVLEN
jgi:penicillin-binding protein 1C